MNYSNVIVMVEYLHRQKERWQKEGHDRLNTQLKMTSMEHV